MSDTLPLGSLFADRYRVDEVLGSGIQKQSYLAWDTKARRPVALSVLAPHAEAASVQREAALLARVGPHDNIVTMYDFGVHDARQYLALEYLPGGELRKYCSDGAYCGGQVPLAVFFRWARQLCRAVSQIHQYRVIHRDISATNIWLDDRQVAHLGDFDTACFLDDDQPWPCDFSTTEGCPAPELLAGAVGDASADVYSLGTVFYELLTGARLMAQDDSQPIAPPSASRDDIPGSLDDLVLSMLAAAPARRPASADDVLAALKRIEPTAELESWIKRGESATLEFKQTLRWDVAAGKTSNEILKMVVKTVCSFLNADGGTLLIGVKDDGELAGLDLDRAALSKPTVDGFELALRQGLANALSPDASQLVTMSFPTIRGIQICRADVRPAPMPVFLIGKGMTPEFRVRKGNQSPALDVKDAYEYIKEHWR
jgi:serine/threonine protein kinase